MLLTDETEWADYYLPGEHRNNGYAEVEASRGCLWRYRVHRPTGRVFRGQFGDLSHTFPCEQKLIDFGYVPGIHPDAEPYCWRENPDGSGRYCNQSPETRYAAH